MNNPAEFQDIESNKCGRLSQVSSQPEMIPSSRALLSRDKRLPHDTWNQSGVQENVFGNQFSTFDSPRDFPQRTPCTSSVQRNREAGPLDLLLKVKTSLTSEDGQNYGTIPMPTFASRPLTTSSKIRLMFRRITWSDSKDRKYRNYNSTSSNPSSFLVWKTRFKTQVSSGSDFPLEAMLWIKLNELKSSRSVNGKVFPICEMLDAKIASALIKIIQNSQFREKVSLEEQKAQKEDRFPCERQNALTIYD